MGASRPRRVPLRADATLHGAPMRAILLAALLLAFATPLAPPAHALEKADQGAIRGAIERQLEAFRRDDAAAAYAEAAPGIQRLFPSDETFMRMVREGYAPVHRPRSFQFAEGGESPAGPTQAVRVRDADGVDWIALYTLERQPDGTWKISGCTLTREGGQNVRLLPSRHTRPRAA